MTVAALLLLMAAAVPGTPARFTAAGRVVMDHQQDLALVGVAVVAITIWVYLLAFG
jgi:hypothetical protein